jgi:hypothetical protein
VSIEVLLKMLDRWENYSVLDVLSAQPPDFSKPRQPVQVQDKSHNDNQVRVHRHLLTYIAKTFISTCEITTIQTTTPKASKSESI